MSAQTDQTDQNASWNAAVVGVLALLARSPVHRDWRVSDIERLILPPLALGQCVLIREHARIVAFASYALLTDGAEEGYVGGARLLQPGDWDAGENVWLIDAFAPFGHARAVTRELRELLRGRGFAARDINFRRSYAGKAQRRYARVQI